jgi:hypothetical protein
MTSFIRLAAIAAAMSIAAQLTGCANVAMTPPQATPANAVKLRAANMAPLAVGSFRLDASKSAGDDTSINMRGSNSVHAPGGSFAQYLGDSLRAELQAAGLLDPASGTVVTGTLTKSELDAAIGTGTAKLGARFVVTRDKAVQYDRELVVDAQWESSFIGGVAIPMAANNYQGLYRKLVGALLDDAAFRSAVAKR